MTVSQTVNDKNLTVSFPSTNGKVNGHKTTECILQIIIIATVF